METMVMPSKQVLSVGRQAAGWLPSMRTTEASCCVSCVSDGTQVLNYSKAGEVTDMDRFALHLLTLLLK